MRIFAVTTAIVLAIEAILVLGFLAGFYWIGGWLPGVLLAIAALVLIAAPWIGQLRVNIDTLAGTAKVKMAWWGSMTQHSKPESLMKICILGICRQKKVEPSAKKSDEETPIHGNLSTTMRMLGRWVGWTEVNLDPVSRTVFAGINAGNQLLWDANAFSVMVQGPTQTMLVDGAMARLINSREIGPLHLTVLDGTERRVLIDYRISIFRAALAGLYAVVQARPKALMRAAKVAKRISEKSRNERAQVKPPVTAGPRPEVVMPPEAQPKEIAKEPRRRVA